MSWVHRPEEDPDFWRQQQDEAHPVHRWGARLCGFALGCVVGYIGFTAVWGTEVWPW